MWPDEQHPVGDEERWLDEIASWPHESDIRANKRIIGEQEKLTMSDYGYEPKTAPSIFLRLKSKGDKVQIRIGSSPYREPKIWRAEGNQPPMRDEDMVRLTEEQWKVIYRDPQYNPGEVFHWKVIDRDDEKAKIYTGGTMIYKAVKKYADTPGWGDPRGYDIVVERTEQPGNYYEITPLPNKSPLTDREQNILESLNLQEKLPAARHINATQIDHISDFDGPSEPEPPVGGAPKQVDDVVIEDISGPINLDDIPF
jgi:hypothetical protein